MKISRRKFLGFSAAGAMLGGGAYSFLIEPGWLRVRHYDLISPKWPSEAKPLRIAFASDIHGGCPSMGAEQIRYIVQKINALSADIILLGGDYLIAGVLLGKYMPPDAIGEILADLKAPLGVYSVLGNHDWVKDGEGMRRALEAGGIGVLENSAIKINQNGHDFWLAGMADDSTRDPDFGKTMSAVTDLAPVIMLAHDPASFLDVDQRPAVTLCGHTHGGQVVIPYISPIIIPGRAPMKYAYGHVQENGRDLIVTSGIGTSVLPVRFGRRPEIVTLTISAGQFFA